MGSGKSSLLNILSLEDSQTSIPDKENQLFPVGAGEKAMTRDVSIHDCHGSSITNGKRLRIIDSPGLD